MEPHRDLASIQRAGRRKARLANRPTARSGSLGLPCPPPPHGRHGPRRPTNPVLSPRWRTPGNLTSMDATSASGACYKVICVLAAPSGGPDAGVQDERCSRADHGRPRWGNRRGLPGTGRLLHRPQRGRPRGGSCADRPERPTHPRLLGLPRCPGRKRHLADAAAPAWTLGFLGITSGLPGGRGRGGNCCGLGAGRNVATKAAQ